MQYGYHKKKFPRDILVYIEEFNKQEGTVVFDFLDSNEYGIFSNLVGREFNLETPSMVLITNYKGKPIQENTIYSIKEDNILLLRDQNLINYNTDKSYLIGHQIDLFKNEKKVFEFSVTIDDSLEAMLANFRMFAKGNPDEISIQHKGKLSVIVRNVGQGNWNEVCSNEKPIIVYDMGAFMSATKSDIIEIIGKRSTYYPISRPLLILSHWDKDHYHALLGMMEVELKHCFSGFICRDYVPTLTSRILFRKIRDAVGTQNTYAIPPEPKLGRGGPHFFNLTSEKRQVVIYNAQQHKNRNISGIALSIKSKNGSMILPGDAHYNQISRDILGNLNFKSDHYLVVPHHGGKAGKYVYSVPPKITVRDAVISVGENSYHHPIESNVDCLETSRFRVLRTDRVGTDIMINL